MAILAHARGFHLPSLFDSEVFRDKPASKGYEHQSSRSWQILDDGDCLTRRLAKL